MHGKTQVVTLPRFTVRQNAQTPKYTGQPSSLFVLTVVFEAKRTTTQSYELATSSFTIYYYYD
jgi:hypothetical protein